MTETLAEDCLSIRNQHVEVDELGDDLKILKLMLSLFPMQGQMKLLGELIKAWKSELLLVSPHFFYLNDGTLGLAGDKITFSYKYL